jgi:glycosyltransferase involved in cell wall biosynthesis
MKISVITVVYNRNDTLESCIKSILCQNYQNIEQIIIDGGSTDGTVGINVGKKEESAGVSFFTAVKNVCRKI